MSGEKRKLCVDASGSLDDRISSKKSKVMIKDLEELKCPICLELPKADVFLCSNGHSVCNECMEKLNSCPTCRVPYQQGPGKIRNHFAEGILSKMLFECPWKEEGCDREELSRQELSEHAADCLFNPTPVQLCRMFFLKDCSYSVSPTFMKNPSLGVDEAILDHVRNAHYEGRASEKATYPGEMVFLSCSKSSKTSYRTKILRLVGNCRSRSTIGLFIVYGFVDVSNTDFKFSWLAVRLSEEPSSCDVTVKMTLKRDAGGAPEDGVSNVETSWNARILSAQEFYLHTKKPIEEQGRFKFSIPWSQIEQFYLNTDGTFDLGFAFTVTEYVESDDEHGDSLGSDDDSNKDSDESE